VNEVVCCKLSLVRQKSVGPYRQQARSRPYADPYSAWTDELPGELGSWSEDEEARRLIYSNSFSDIVR